MSIFSLSLRSVAFFLCLLAAVSVDARSEYMLEIPNADNVTTHGELITCPGHYSRHPSPEEPDANDFGVAFAKHGHTWSSALCWEDSDSDGYHNGMELGDPACVWQRGAKPHRTAYISDPGDAGSIPPPEAFDPDTTTVLPTEPPSTTPATTTAPPTTTAVPRNLSAWQFRLADSDDYGGRLEMRPDEQAEWGTVCRFHFELNEARAACRSVGYSLASDDWVAVRRTSGEQFQPMYLSHVNCSTPDLLLQQCAFVYTDQGHPVLPEDCTQDDAVGVQCLESTTPTPNTGVLFEATFNSSLIATTVADLFEKDIESWYRIPESRIIFYYISTIKVYPNNIATVPRLFHLHSGRGSLPPGGELAC